jgi:hypothetical protein
MTVLRGPRLYFEQNDVVHYAQGPPAIGQDPQHRQLLVIDDHAQASHAGRGQRDRVRVAHIGLSALTGGEHPGAGGKLRRHIHDPLSVGKQRQPIPITQHGYLGQ